MIIGKRLYIKLSTTVNDETGNLVRDVICSVSSEVMRLIDHEIYDSVEETVVMGIHEIILSRYDNRRIS